ncbi:hypothetical protein WICPIJ_003658 [Wickerhamomyces pijperi]|uniref:RRM domain-containing protein n=1 Tax=Wickerhamomyces pijperi TaxID=599730 RepID=A0A9P8Q713_WICPI|nr:hypothetical protein WICPIJ_003658 [Wickerhamomyces pijperi]
MSQEEQQPVSIDNQAPENAGVLHSTAPVSQYTKDFKFPTRLYISNVSYKTTEEDLWELFKDFDAVYILVPTQTVKLSLKHHQKSFGIAYINFKTKDAATLAAEALDGTVLDGRPIRVKQFVPYRPSKSSKKGKKSEAVAETEAVKEEESPATSPEEREKEELPSAETEATEKETSPAVQDEDAIEKDPVSDEAESPKSSKPAREYSEDTVYIARLHHSVTDGDLREYFHVYGPTAVYIFKSYVRPKRFSFRNKHVSALVTLSAENGLSDALAQLKGTKLKGRNVKLDAAFKDKLEEVTNAARALEKQSQEIEEQAQQAALAAVGKPSTDAEALDEVDVAEQEAATPKVETKQVEQGEQGEQVEQVEQVNEQSPEPIAEDVQIEHSESVQEQY